MVEICAKCGQSINTGEIHLCPLDKSSFFQPMNNIEIGNPANILVGFDTKTDQIKKLNDELEDVKTESTYKDEYILKIKKRNKKLLEKIQELYHKYLEKAAPLTPESVDEEVMKIIDDLLNEVIIDINDLIKFVK